MKYLEINTVKRTMLPITIFNWLFGAAAFEYPVGRRYPNLSAGWSFLHFMVTVLFVILADITNPVTYGGSVIVAVNMQIYYVYNLIMMMLLLYIGQKKSKLVSECLDKLESLNNVLKNMNIPDNYERTFNILILKTVGTFVPSVIVAWVASDHWVGRYPSKLSYFGLSASYYHSLILCSVVEITLATYIGYIGNRFWHLNEHLRNKLSVEDSTIASLCDRSISHRIPTIRSTIREDTGSMIAMREQRRLHLLRKLKQIHRSLCHLARGMIEAYEIQALFAIMASVMRISSFCYVTYGTIIDLPHDPLMNEATIVLLVSCCYWIMFNSMKIFLVVDGCSRTSAEARRTVSLIYEIFTPTSSTEMEAEVRALTLQLMQDPLNFTASGILTLNYELIGEIASYVITYVVLLLQFRDIGADGDAIASNSTMVTTNSTTYC